MTDPDRTHRTLGRRMGLLATVAFLGFGWATFDRVITQRDDPNHALTVTQGVDEWVLRRNRAGHYVSPGWINGQPVRFLLDTGATHTTVPAHLAQRLGLNPGAASTVSTANGTVVVRATTLASLEIGPFRFSGAPAQLNPGMRGEEVLLGMSLLKHLTFTQRGDVLILRKPSD